MYEELKMLVSKYTSVDLDSIKPDDRLKDELAIDSISMLFLIIDTEDYFGIEISDEIIADNPDVENLCCYISSAINKKYSLMTAADF